MKIRLHVVVDKEDDAIVELVQNALNEICSKCLILQVVYSQV